MEPLSLETLRRIDRAHLIHPFTDHKELRGAGSRMIVRADGAYIYDSDGNRILDGMAGLWCVAVGYGRKELAEVAYEQMLELPYYNSFFKCTTPTPALLAQKLAELAPKSVNQVFFGSSGSESNDTALRLVRHYWALEGKPEKNIVTRPAAPYAASSTPVVRSGREPRASRNTPMPNPNARRSYIRKRGSTIGLEGAPMAPSSLIACETKLYPG